MAEVKPLYSSVGAFEAQVFPMNQASDAFMRQKQAEAQRARALEKSLDEQMASTYSDKAAGRQQDLEGLENEYKGLQEYYLNNKEKILRGGSAALEFQKKRSAYLFNVQTSKALKERERNLLPYMKTVAGKTELEPEQITAIEAFNASIYDPKRKEFKFSDGRDIDLITQYDVTPSESFNKVSMDKTVANNVKDYKFGVDVEKGGKKVREEFTMQDPSKILLGTTSYLAQYPKAERFYINEFKSLKPEDIEQASREMAGYASLFTNNKSNPIAWDKDSDGKISNHIEYAVYDQIKRNLPENLGSKFDFSPANLKLKEDANARAWQQFRLSKQKYYDKLVETANNKPIDEVISDNILSGTITDSDWSRYANSINMVYAKPQEGTGNVTPSAVRYLSPEELKRSLKDREFNKKYVNSVYGENPNAMKGGALMFTSQTRISDAEGVPIKGTSATDVGEALKQGIPAKEISYKRLPDGTYEFYRRQTMFVSTDKGRDPQKVRFEVKSGYSLLSSSVQDDPVLKQIDEQLTKRQTGFVAAPAEDTPVGGGGQNKPKKTSKTKSSSSTNIQRN